jgi:hypothetical protein
MKIGLNIPNYYHVRALNRTLGSNALNPDSAVEGEAQDKAQAFRSERNGPVPVSAVAGIGAMSRVLNVANEVPSNKKTLKHYGSMRSLLQAHASPAQVIQLNCGIGLS